MKHLVTHFRFTILLIGFFLCINNVAAQNNTLPFIDSVQYRILKVKPSVTNASIHQWDTTHVVYYEPSIKSNKLLLWLAGTNGTPLSIPVELFKTALNQGYRIIALSYITIPAVSQVCLGNVLDSNVNCAEIFRRKRIYGEGDFSYIKDEPQDAIVPRLLKLLLWLSKNDAKGNWSNYLNSDGSKPNWKNIAVSGQSQGGGMSQFIAQQESVARVISFSGGWDYANSKEKKIANWYYNKSVTPMEKWFATYNINELAAKQLNEICNSLQIPAQQIFALDKPLINSNTSTDNPNPYHGDGIRNIAYKPIWIKMLGSGLE
jgi:hypothetical protein